jgi:cell division GTPase FtsZ
MKYNGQNDQLGNSITINALQDDANYYDGTPYLFISAGSGGGAGYMYLDWVIVTYGVPYIASVS